MAVDLNKIKANKRRHEQQETEEAYVRKSDQFAKARVLDFVGLKKKWAKKAGYWISILYNEKLGLYAIRKKWSYWSSHEVRQIEDENISGRTSSSGGAAQHYVDAINSKLNTEYEVVERAASPESPALDHDFGTPSEQTRLTVSDNPTVPDPDRPLKRKASYDVW